MKDTRIEFLCGWVPGKNVKSTEINRWSSTYTRRSDRKLLVFIIFGGYLDFRSLYLGLLFPNAALGTAKSGVWIICSTATWWMDSNMPIICLRQRGWMNWMRLSSISMRLTLPHSLCWRILFIFLIKCNVVNSRSIHMAYDRREMLRVVYSQCYKRTSWSISSSVYGRWIKNPYRLKC